MTPIDLARNFARSDDPKARAYGVAMIYRSLTEPDESDPLKLPWPETNETIERAAKYLGVADEDITPDLRNDVRDIAPTLSDAILNKGASA